MVNVNFYEMAKQLLGELPQSSMFLYDVTTILLIVFTLFLVIFPIVLISRYKF